MSLKTTLARLEKTFRERDRRTNAGKYAEVAERVALESLEDWQICESLARIGSVAAAMGNPELLEVSRRALALARSFQTPDGVPAGPIEPE